MNYFNNQLIQHKTSNNEMHQILRFLIIFSVEKKMNINLFLSACRKLDVGSKLKNAEAIEKLDIKNWTEFLKTLQSFSKKMRKMNNRASFILDEKAIKDLIDRAKHATTTNEYDEANSEIYGSPFQQTLNTKDLYNIYVSGAFK